MLQSIYTAVSNRDANTLTQLITAATGCCSSAPTRTSGMTMPQTVEAMLDRAGRGRS